MKTKSLAPEDGSDPKKEQIRQEHQPPVVTSPNSVLFIFAESPKTLQFEFAEQVILGRRSESGEQPDVDLAPFGGYPAGVSRLHLRLHRTPEGVFVEDLSSRNGTFLDGDKVPPGEIVAVKNGQHVKMGALQGWIYFENTAD